MLIVPSSDSPGTETNPLAFQHATLTMNMSNDGAIGLEEGMKRTAARIREQLSLTTSPHNEDQNHLLRAIIQLTVLVTDFQNHSFAPFLLIVSIKNGTRYKVVVCN